MSDPLRLAAQRVIDLADNEGCSWNLTVTSSDAIEDLKTSLVGYDQVERRHLFTERVLRLIAVRDDQDSYYWNSDLRFYATCNDFFYWGCSDAEEITPENIDLLDRSYEDVISAGDQYAQYATGLFCARVRKMRPQGCCYPKNQPGLWPLFDACGPKREIDLVNPYEHPDDGGRYAYTEPLESKLS